MSAVLERTACEATDADARASCLSRLRGFDSGAVEFDDTPCEVQGALPEWLRGSLLLNGPALWELPKGRYAHWFDGLAMLHRLRFDGAVPPVYRSRFARSQSFDLAQAAGRWWASSPRATPSPGFRASPTSSTRAAVTTRRW